MYRGGWDSKKNCRDVYQCYAWYVLRACRFGDEDSGGGCRAVGDTISALDFRTQPAAEHSGQNAAQLGLRIGTNGRQCSSIGNLCRKGCTKPNNGSRQQPWQSMPETVISCPAFLGSNRIDSLLRWIPVAGMPTFWLLPVHSPPFRKFPTGYRTFP